ncbi:MAG: sterol desaturase family protein [Myxococcota bacterium]|nr:sterol desaturase family protein [Myxococcota bacterium]
MQTIVATFFLFALLECCFKGYVWPKEPRWAVRGIAYLALVIAMGEWVAPAMHRLIHPYALWDLSSLGLWALLPTLFVYEVLVYLFHRALHDIPFLWRIHQTHHSTERLDIWSAYHAHPLETIIFMFVGALVSHVLLGVTAETSFWLTMILVPIQTFEHTNIRTPKWLGYVIARPENHMLHHARGVHRANYADIPIIDMIFGTFVLPEKAPDSVGFWDGASQQFIRKWSLKDISEPQEQRMSAL